jgi:hypothetical protein
MEQAGNCAMAAESEGQEREISSAGGRGYREEGNEVSVSFVGSGFGGCASEAGHAEFANSEEETSSRRQTPHRVVQVLPEHPGANTPLPGTHGASSAEDAECGQGVAARIDAVPIQQAGGCSTAVGAGAEGIVATQTNPHGSSSDAEKEWLHVRRSFVGKLAAAPTLQPEGGSTSLGPGSKRASVASSLGQHFHRDGGSHEPSCRLESKRSSWTSSLGRYFQRDSVSREPSFEEHSGRCTSLTDDESARSISARKHRTSVYMLRRRR